MPISQNLTDTHPIHPVTSTPSAPIQFNLHDLDSALNAIEGYLPTALAVIGTFYPPVGAFAKFLPLFAVAVKAVDTVAKATGSDTAAATQSVADTLTPGQPSAPALN